ncbi:hypothetical protein KSS87_007771 [Heliosperma pusillum]|nr:hypothetical protein KSS87_007771 [Heliosperma pusillum]
MNQVLCFSIACTLPQSLEDEDGERWALVSEDASQIVARLLRLWAEVVDMNSVSETMARIESEESRLEVDSISQDEPPQIRSPQNTETDSEHKMICILIGIYLINQVLCFSIACTLAQSFEDEDGESWALVLEGASQIVACLLSSWAEVVVMNSVSTFKQCKIFDVCTEKWIKVSETMASIESEESRLVVDSISSEQPPQILLPQNTETDSVSVKVENPVAYAFITVVTVAILPLLLVAFVFVRLFQIIVRAERYVTRILVMILLRYWTFVAVMLLLVEVGIFYPIAKNVPGLKLVMIIGLPITKWIKMICILIGIYLIGQLIWVFMFYMLICVFNDTDEIVNFHWESISEITRCLLVLWANVVVMSSVPIFKQSKIFGIPTDKWVKVSLFVLIGYNIITSLMHILVQSLLKIYGDPLEVGENIKTILSSVCCDDFTKGNFNKKNIVYIASGIKRSIIFILSMVMLLITWMVYFGNRLDTAPKNQRILDFGIWTFVSLLICSFLWLFKSCLLLYWEAHTVYDRLHPKIRDIGKQLYFLVMLSHEHYKQATRYAATELNDSDCGLSSCFKAPPQKMVVWILPDNSDEDYIYRRLDRKIVRAEFINCTGIKASIYDIQKAAQRFLSAQNALANENTVGDLQHLEGGNDSGESNARCIEVLKKVVQVEGDSYFDDDWEMFLKLLPDVHTTEDITFQKVKTFMERAHSRCMFLTNTLISENEVVKCLNRVISGVIIAVTCLMWLLLTGLATTKVLVLVASPLLAATFIFGDTAKNLFQGLIFVYVVHPFDVGDLCLIDEKLLEVSRIGVWSTIFANVRTVGEQQQIIYPNSVLALKNIINHKSHFDWNDYIEFITSPDNKITEPLKHKIETYLDDEKDKFTPNFHSVDILEMGDKAKIVVHVKHKFKTTEGWTYFECLKAKEKRRFEFAIYVQKLLKQLESETKTPESLAEMEQELTKG